MIFEPVWLSSVGHLESFTRIFREAASWRRLLGAYELPPGFPYVQPLWGFYPFMRVPVVTLRNGEIDLGNGRLTFTARPLRMPVCRVRNVPADGSFSLRIDELTQVERFDFISPVARYFTIPFTRLRSVRPGELSDFLLCVGGYGFRMQRVRERSLMLLDALQTAAATNRLC